MIYLNDGKWKVKRKEKKRRLGRRTTPGKKNKKKTTPSISEGFTPSGCFFCSHDWQFHDPPSWRQATSKDVNDVWSGGQTRTVLTHDQGTARLYTTLTDVAALPFSTPAPHQRNDHILAGVLFRASRTETWTATEEPSWEKAPTAVSSYEWKLVERQRDLMWARFCESG